MICAGCQSFRTIFIVIKSSVSKKKTHVSIDLELQTKKCALWNSYVSTLLWITLKKVSLVLKSDLFWCWCCCWVTSVVSHSVQHYGLQPARLFCQWDSPDKNAGVGCHALLRGLFPTQGSNPGLLNCRQILNRWATTEARFHANHN